jgi:hypothetical protein
LSEKLQNGRPWFPLELCAGAGVPELRHILPVPENSGKNSGRQNYEKLFHISTNIWH